MYFKMAKHIKNWDYARFPNYLIDFFCKYFVSIDWVGLMFIIFILIFGPCLNTVIDNFMLQKSFFFCNAYVRFTIFLLWVLHNYNFSQLSISYLLFDKTQYGLIFIWHLWKHWESFTMLWYDLLKGQTLNSGLQFHTQKLLNVLPLRKSHLRCFSAEIISFCWSESKLDKHLHNKKN